MKKRMTMLLCCVLALGLTACGAGTDGGPEDSTPQEHALHFEVAVQVYENEYKADDGTLLLSEHYELPQLELRNADGTVYDAAEDVTANGGAGETAQLRVQAAFNAEMENVLAALRADAGEMAKEAKEYYAKNDTSVFLGSYWASELSLTQTYMTEGKLLSVAAENYTYYGGAHPNFVTRAWNFDLTAGEFLTIDDLSSEEGDVNGNTLRERIYWSIASQISEQDLSEGYFDDYGSYLLDFPSFATLCFTESGLTVTFDQYVIAPYAAGPQVFEVPYNVFYSALSEHAKELLDVSQEQIVLSDFDTAATLWSWFYMGDPPMDCNVTSEVNGSLYYLTDIDGVKTMKDLRTLLCRYVTPELAGEWLDSAGQRYCDIDGQLYAMSAGRGSNESLGKDTRSVALNGDGGVLTQTVALLEWDDTAQAWTDTGKTETYEYPFTLVDGHAVFSAFPYPY